jgi:hypothetical protein
MDPNKPSGLKKPGFSRLPTGNTIINFKIDFYF